MLDTAVAGAIHTLPCSADAATVDIDITIAALIETIIVLKALFVI